MEKITIYGKPNCVQCSATKRAFERAGIATTYVDVTEDPAAFEHVQTLGYTQAPVVEYGTTSWSGFRPDLITAITH